MANQTTAAELATLRANIANDQSFSPDTFQKFSPEVQAALTANRTKGQKNLVFGGSLVERDPAFAYGTPAATSGTDTGTATPASPLSVLPSKADISSSVDSMFQGLSGMVASSTFPQDRIDAITAANNDREAQLKAQLEAEYGNQKDQILKAGRAATGMVEAGTRLPGGIGSTGLGASSIRQDLINAEQARIDESMRKLQQAHDAAVNNLDFSTAQAIKDQIAQEQDNANKLRQQQFDNVMSIIKTGLSLADSRRQDFQLNLDTLKAVSDIPAGQQVTVNGVTFTGVKQPEPFFTSSSLIELMKQLPVGTTQDVTDPNTGKTYTLQGLQDPTSRLKQYTATDDSGTLSIINFDPSTGSIVSIARAAGVGNRQQGPGDKLATQFQSAFRSGVSKLYAGGYNKDGAPQFARERLISDLAGQFPEMSRDTITNMVQYSIPDGYEQQIRTKSGTDNSSDVSFYADAILRGENDYYNFDKNDNPTSINWSAVPAALRADVESKLQESGFYDQQGSGSSGNLNFNGVDPWDVLKASISPFSSFGK